MAKVIKNLRMEMQSEDGAPNYNKAILVYTVSSSDDASLTKTVVKELTLSGQDLTDAQGLFALAKAEAESDEGIV